MNRDWKPIAVAGMAATLVLVLFSSQVHAQRFIWRSGTPTVNVPMMPIPSKSPSTTTPPTTTPNSPSGIPPTWVNPNYNPTSSWASYAGGYGGSYGGGYGNAPSPGDYANAMMQYAGSNGSYKRDRRASYSTPANYSQGPSAEERQQSAAEEALQRSLKPAGDEIMSAKALNVLLADIKKTADKLGWEGLPTANLDAESAVWQHVNFSSGEGTIAVLKNGMPLTWPVTLNGADDAEQRKQFENLNAQALLQARSQGTVDVAVTSMLGDLVDGFQRDLRRKTPSLTFDRHLEAKSFLRSLEEAVVTLQRPDAGTHVADSFLTPNATTVLELVKWMDNRGLRFGRAMPGDAAAYAALHQKLATYDRLLKDMSSTQ